MSPPIAYSFDRMSSQASQTSAAAHRPTDEPYIPVEEIARRLDLPLAILLRRIEAGDVPARRVLGGTGSGWGIRLSDLGIESAADVRRPEVTHEAQPQSRSAEPLAVAPAVPLVEQQHAAEHHAAEEQQAAEIRQSAGSLVMGEPAPGAPEMTQQEDPFQPVSVTGRITRYERGTRGPRGEVAGMFIDSRELVSGLLDRWERTLEQRIFIEQRQRFEGELNARQNLVKQLQLELQTAHAEHAAYVADSERRYLELEHQIADLQRELNMGNELHARRRGLFYRR